MAGLRAAALFTALVLLSAPGCSDSANRNRPIRHYEYRAISGFSMGSMSAAILGLRHNELFDIVAPLGGSIDLGLFLHIIKDELMAGFCIPPEVGRMCPTAPGAPTYEEMDVGLPSQGAFRRENMIEAFQDMAIAMGNPIMFNPAHPYLPPGIPTSYLDRSRAEKCSDPIRLEGFYDWKYNPDGISPVITFCEEDGIERGVFNPDAVPDFPTEISLAVDLNDNGRRDSGEPVLFQASERYDDTGEDGLFSEQESGFDSQANPDPAGDDWDRMENPFGTEGNHVWDEGEAYLDYGLDGVDGTVESPYDWGEGNGRYDLNLNLMRAAVMYDPARMLEDLTDDQLARLDFYIDVGVRDHLRFLDTCESFAGILKARGRPIQIADTFPSLLDPEWEGAFDIRHVDWEPISRDLMVRYGSFDATPEVIATGDGGHVGSYNQTLWRFFMVAAYVSERWPGGDFEEISPCPAPSSLLVDETYYSEILDEDRQYYVLLPPGYADSSEKRYPVHYVIHGIGMSATELTASALFTPDWMCQGLLQKYIYVFPDGRCPPDECNSGTFFLDQQGRSMAGRQYETAFFEEFIQHIDATYRTRSAEDIEVSEEYLAPLTF